MIGLDTNVLVRYIAQDDPQQSLKASEIIESLDNERSAYISTISLVELVWVLSRAYKVQKEELCSVIESLLQIRFLIIENAEMVWRALRAYKSGMADFADCLIIQSSINAECSSFLTFDVKASKYVGVSTELFKVSLIK